MVKGISRQVIVVQSPDKDLFEQAIFILTDAAVEKGVTDQMLLKQANRAIRPSTQKKMPIYYFGPVWAFAGAGFTGLAWLLSQIL